MPIIYGSVGTLIAGASSIVVDHPTGSWNDVVLFYVAQKENVGSGPIGTPAGLTKLGEILSTTGVAGADTGPVRIAAYKRVLDDSETSTSYTFTGSSDIMWGQGIRVTKDAPGAWTIDAVTGTDAVAGAAWSAVLGSLSLGAGDLCVVGSVIPTDVTTPSQFSAEAIAATGMTFGSMTEVSEPDTTSGNDLGGFIFYQPITAGTPASVAPTVTATAGGTTTNVYGATILVRLRLAETDPTREASTYLQLNIGAVDITNLAPREDATYLDVNVAAYEVVGIATLEGWSFGEDVSGTLREEIPPDGDASSYLYVNIT